MYILKANYIVSNDSYRLNIFTVRATVDFCNNAVMNIKMHVHVNAYWRVSVSDLCKGNTGSRMIYDTVSG